MSLPLPLSCLIKAVAANLPEIEPAQGGSGGPILQGHSCARDMAIFGGP